MNDIDLNPIAFQDDPPQPCQPCQSCGHSGGLFDFDCGGLPDGMVFCPKCLDIIEVGSGASVDCDDLELNATEL